MLNFLAYNHTRHQNSEWTQNETFFLVCYIDRYDIFNQQIRKIQAYHRKTSCDFSVTLHSRKNIFCHTKLQTIIIKVVLSKFLYLIANRTSYPKPMKEATAI